MLNISSLSRSTTVFLILSLLQLLHVHCSLPEWHQLRGRSGLPRPPLHQGTIQAEASLARGRQRGQREGRVGMQGRVGERVGMEGQTVKWERDRGRWKNRGEGGEEVRKIVGGRQVGRVGRRGRRVKEI